MTLTNKIIVSALAALILTLFAYVLTQKDPAYGSVVVGNEYNATTTGSGAAYGNTITGDQNLTGTTSPVAGSLGSVVITGANTGIWHLYDATTTDVNKRTGNRATSTILLATFPASIAAGTYTFDAQYNHGLLLDYTSGIMPTTTITYR